MIIINDQDMMLVMIRVRNIHGGQNEMIIFIDITHVIPDDQNVIYPVNNCDYHNPELL